MSIRGYGLFNRYTRVSIVLMLVFHLFWPAVAYASTNQLFISPASSQVSKGATFAVNVKSYSQTAASPSTANGTLLYNSSLLQVVNISIASSDYDNPSISQGTGAMGFSATRQSPKSGIMQIFSITFKAINAGTATVSFNNNSKVNGTTTTYTSGVFTITSPAPQPSPKPSSTPKPPSSNPPTKSVSPPAPSPSSTPVEPEPTPDPMGIVDNVIVNPTYTSGTISWKINASNSSSTVLYGESASQINKQVAVQKKSDGTFAATISNLKPGLRYYFSISGGGAGQSNGTYSGSIITRGYPVVMTVTENNIPAKNALVRIDNRSYSVGSNGKVTVSLSEGNHTGNITTNTASMTLSVTVVAKEIPSDGSAPESQAFTYNLTSSPLEAGPGSGTSILAFVGVLVAGLFILGGGFIVFITMRRRRFEQEDYSVTRGQTVIIDDGYDWQRYANTPTTSVNQPDIPTPVNTAPNSISPSTYGDEPLDMFEEAKLRDQKTSTQSLSSQNVTTHTPS